MLKPVFKYTPKVLGFSTIGFKQMSYVIKLQLQSETSAIKAIICWIMQSASAENVIPRPNAIFAQLNKHSEQRQRHFPRCLCFCAFPYYFLLIKYILLLAAWKNISSIRSTRMLLRRAYEHRGWCNLRYSQVVNNKRDL